MLVKSNIDPLEYPNISYSVTLVPRLQYSLDLLDEIVEILKNERDGLKKSNKEMTSHFDETDEIFLKSIESERIMIFSLELLYEIKKRTKNISGIISIPEILPSSIQIIRIVSAQLFHVIPNCSQKLSELSVYLGSVVLDSAALTKARFDFAQSNDESSILLDKVKLMSDSKISKQYPNLKFFKSCDA